MTRPSSTVQGIVIGVLLTLMVVGFVLFLHHGRYLCFTWGKPGQLRQCRVYRETWFFGW